MTELGGVHTIHTISGPHAVEIAESIASHRDWTAGALGPVDHDDPGTPIVELRRSTGQCPAAVSMCAPGVAEAERKAFGELFNPNLTCRLQAGHAGVVHVDATYFPTRPWRTPITLAATT